jgi:hypothetical protein
MSRTEWLRWFSLTLPANWEEYDDGEEGTYAFFNVNIWTGNFRITPFRWTESVDPSEDKAGQFIEEELNSNEGATRFMLGDLNCTQYKKNIFQDKDELLMYCWVTGKNEKIFICSFTINKKDEETDQNINELKIVEDIIKSIEVN